jgi:hypothetical protein
MPMGHPFRRALASRPEYRGDRAVRARRRHGRRARRRTRDGESASAAGSAVQAGRVHGRIGETRWPDTSRCGDTQLARRRRKLAPLCGRRRQRSRRRPSRRRGGRVREEQRVWRSRPLASKGAVAQRVEIGGVNRGGRRRRRAIQQQGAQALAILVPADQVADIFAGRPETASGHPFIDEGLEGVGEGYVHRGHVQNVRAWQNLARAQAGGGAGEPSLWCGCC